jgi:hypothetical protein
MADDYGCFGSDTPEQQQAHDGWLDPYDDGWRAAVSWVEEFLERELEFMLAFEQELIELGLLG